MTEQKSPLDPAELEFLLEGGEPKKRGPAAEETFQEADFVTIRGDLANISLRVGRAIRWDAQKEEIIGDREAATYLEQPYRTPWDAELRSLGIG